MDTDLRVRLSSRDVQEMCVHFGSLRWSLYLAELFVDLYILELGILRSVYYHLPCWGVFLYDLYFCVKAEKHNYLIYIPGINCIGLI